MVTYQGLFKLNAFTDIEKCGYFAVMSKKIVICLLDSFLKKKQY